MSRTQIPTQTKPLFNLPIKNLNQRMSLLTCQTQIPFPEKTSVASLNAAFRENEKRWIQNENGRSKVAKGDAADSKLIAEIQNYKRNPEL